MTFSKELLEDLYIEQGKLNRKFSETIPMWETTKKNITTHPDLYKTNLKVTDIQSTVLSEIRDKEEVEQIFNLKIGKFLEDYLP